MKSFQFPLERVLDLRRKQAQIEELKLETILQECLRIRRESERIAEQARAAAKQVLEKLVLEPIELESLYHFRGWTQTQMLILENQLREAEGRAAQQRLILNDARRNIRLIEKLRERRLSEWDAAFQKDLEEQASESHLSRWNRERNFAAKKSA